MPREANAIDFWRGFALVSIFINHIPGICYERLTHRNFSISDSAELFVFLAGWSLGLLVGSRSDAKTACRVLGFRLGGRAVQIYAAHILISGTGARPARRRRLLSRTTRSFSSGTTRPPFFQDPAHAQIGIVLLTHQLGYFDILPLYVVLMLAAPALRRHRPVRPAAARAALACALLRLAHGAVHGADLAGRGPVVLQSVHLAGDLRAGLRLVARRRARRCCAAQHQMDPVCCGARSSSSRAILVLFNWFPDPTKLPEPQAAVPQRQELPDADAAHAVSGAGGGVFRGLPADCAPACLAAGVSVDPGAQFSSTCFAWDRC